MEEFLTGLVLPFAAVLMTVVGLTLALFDVPGTPPETRHSRTTGHAVGALTVNDALAHALSALDRTRATGLGPNPRPAQSQTQTVSLAVAKAGAPTPLGSPPDGTVLTAVSALGNAVKAVRDARTEEDIVHAEEEMRSAREQMEATCTGAGGPLCDSAREVRSLGY